MLMLLSILLFQDTLRLPQVAVQASRHQPPAQVVDTFALSNRNNYSVADALRHLSGIQLKDYGGVGGVKTIDVRGMGSHHTSVLLDGLPVFNAQNGVVDLSRFTTSSLSSATLESLSFSGSTASSALLMSALSLRTRRPGASALSIAQRVAAFTTFSTSLSLAKVGKAAHLLTVEPLYTKGNYPFTVKVTSDEGGYDLRLRRDNSSLRSLNQSYDLFAGGHHFKQTFFLSGRGYPGAVVREPEWNGSSLAFPAKDTQEDASFAAQYTFTPARTKGLTVASKFQYDFTHYLSDPNEDYSTMYVSNYYRQYNGYLSLAYKGKTRWFSYGLSVDHTASYLSANLYRFPDPKRFDTGVLASVSKRFPLFGMDASSFASLAFTHVQDIATNRPTFVRVSPSFYLVLAKGGFSQSLSLKKSHRLPTFNDLYYTLIGNSSLSPEVSFQIEWTPAFSLSTPRMSLALTAPVFYNRTHDKIVAVPTSNQFRWTMYNLGDVRSLGVSPVIEGTLTLPRPAARLHGKLSYTYQPARDFSSPEKGQIPYLPKHALTLVANLSLASFRAGLSFLYTGKRWDSTSNVARNYLTPWCTTDVYLGYDYRKFSVDLQLNNLFNQQYALIRNYPLPGFNWSLTVRYETSLL